MRYIFWLIVLVCMNSSFADQQYYDPSDCYSEESQRGSKYTCNISSQTSCKTFLVYRANQHFQTISNISDLFNVKSDAVLQLNNLTSPFEVLKPGREVLVPITCSCSGQFFQANFSYTVSKSIASFSEIACGVFEGLLKLHTLTEGNPSGGNKNITAGSNLQVPLKCACPDNFTTSKKIEYLVTYPIVEGDETVPLSKKFEISPEDLWEVNHLDPFPTVYPETTILVPLRDIPPAINFIILAGSPPPTPGFLPTIPVEEATKNTKLRRNIYIAGSVVGVSLLLVALASCGLFIKALKKWKDDKYQCFTPRGSPISCSTPRSSPRFHQTGTGSSTNSCLSPDELAGAKFSLFNYSMEEIKKATKDFSEESKMSNEVYEGLMDNDKVMIKRLRFEDTRQVIDVHSKINHFNIVKLQGVCYGENDFSWSYLVFDFPGNCLRDCLSDTSDHHPLSWDQRTQIAFDIATGLHYLHRYTFPSYAHMRVSTGNIFVTANCRAKLGNIGATLVVGSSSSRRGSTYKSKSVRGWVAPEFHLHNSASEKVDIFAFGVVLLELISAREDSDGKLFKESIRFLGGGASGGCFEQLKSFMDPNLKEDYSLAEALCIAVLAKACVEEDPLHRPSMDDIIKVIARMV